MVESTNGQIQTLKKDGEALRGQIDNTLEEVQKALAELAPDQKMAEARSELHDALCKLKEDSLDQLEALESIPMVRCPPDSSPWKRRSRLDQLDQWDSQKMELEKEQKERERRIEQDREMERRALEESRYRTPQPSHSDRDDHSSSNRRRRGSRGRDSHEPPQASSRHPTWYEDRDRREERRVSVEIPTSQPASRENKPRRRVPTELPGLSPGHLSPEVHSQRRHSNRGGTHRSSTHLGHYSRAPPERVRGGVEERIARQLAKEEKERRYGGSPDLRKAVARGGRTPDDLQQYEDEGLKLVETHIGGGHVRVAPEAKYAEANKVNSPQYKSPSEGPPSPRKRAKGKRESKLPLRNEPRQETQRSQGADPLVRRRGPGGSSARLAKLGTEEEPAEVASGLVSEIMHGLDANGNGLVGIQEIEEAERRFGPNTATGGFARWFLSKVPPRNKPMWQFYDFDKGGQFDEAEISVAINDWDAER